MRIYLIGFMGSGKSFVSKRLASRLCFPFIDLDQLIEAREGTTITAIFSDEGEAIFREMEAESLRDTEAFTIAIIACGGGTPCYHDNMNWMNKHGMTVYLDVDEEILARRLEREAEHRPVLQEGESIRAVIQAKLAERRSFYEQAHLHIKITDEQTKVAELISKHYLDITGH